MRYGEPVLEIVPGEAYAITASVHGYGHRSPQPVRGVALGRGPKSRRQGATFLLADGQRVKRSGDSIFGTWKALLDYQAECKKRVEELEALRKPHKERFEILKDALAILGLDRDPHLSLWPVEHAKADDATVSIHFTLTEALEIFGRMADAKSRSAA